MSGENEAEDVALVAREPLVDNALLGSILTGMFTQSAAISNNLIDRHLDEAIDWAENFRRLWYQVNYANENGNALAVDRVLDNWHYDAQRSVGAVDHYKNMKMNPDERVERTY